MRKIKEEEQGMGNEIIIMNGALQEFYTVFFI